tara:strand:+ start:1448 stop:2218 length:771 start_codon:yes stop_codon:yes gene_type:complete
MDIQETTDLLLLFRILEDKPVQLSRLLRHFGSTQAVIHSLPEVAVSGVNKKTVGHLQHQMSTQRYRDKLQRKVDSDQRWLQGKDNHLLVLDTPDYPDLLAEISDPPVLVFCRGDLEAIKALKIAIVGSRNPTVAGTRHAGEFARAFASLSIAVTSGLALGIDSAGHRGALAAGGLTLAVLGSGCDVIYPMRHRQLARQICEKGLLVSEFPLGTRAYPGNFPRRNRIVTGLSLGTLVVEAQEQGGSLISARLAMEQG